MAEAHVISVLGLGFGDEGKGRFTDFLARHLGAHTVVRFNGGAQAGHNVASDDGRHHTFAQFGSATFRPKVMTVLAHSAVVHPTALLVEAERLTRVGVDDALDRILIDPRCRVNTPFHQAAGRLREWARGAAAHGTCGVGVGETVRCGLTWPEEALHFGELRRPALAVQKLEALRARLRSELEDRSYPSEAGPELQALRDPELSARWLVRVQELLRRLPEAGSDPLSERLHRTGTVIFEGAQGLLLDEWRGFHPHTTWSSPTPQAVDSLVAEAGIHAPARHLGVLRSYLTRHGAGPLPTEDPALDALPEPHNAEDGWQGRFRRGHLDGVLLAYAREMAGPLDGVLLSHLDAFEHGIPLRWCEAYDTGTGLVQRLPMSPAPDLGHQEALTRILWGVRPRWAPESVRTPEALVARLEGALGCPVRFGSSGPGTLETRTFKGLE